MDLLFLEEQEQDVVVQDVSRDDSRNDDSGDRD